MERDYTDSGNYGYGYEQPHYFYHQTSPVYHDQGYGVQQGNGQQYGGWEHQNWQGYGQPQMYNNGYGNQGFNYDYYGNYGGDPSYNAGYDMMYVQQNYDGSQTDGNQDRAMPTQSTRSKHSYSQNRNRNRQRPEFNQNTQFDVPNTNFSSSNSNTNNNSDWSVELTQGANKIDLSQETASSNNAKSQNKENTLVNTTFDRGKNRGGRFQGTDTRSKPFNRAQQFDDRQRGYNKNFTPSDSSSLKGPDGVVETNDEKVEKISENVAKQDEDLKVNNKFVKGAKPKSYRDSRAERAAGARSDKFMRGRNDRDWRTNRDEKDNKSKGFNGPRERFDDKSLRNKEKNEHSDKNEIPKSEDQLKVPSDVKAKDVSDENYDSSGDGKGNRKKKREIQLFTSSGHRDLQSKTTITSQKYNAQHAHDRYNYRGQDYNKRHKEVVAGNLERGGDRTKLSSINNGENDNISDNEEESSNSSKNKPRQKKTQNVGPSRGSRYKNKGKVDESQRGVLIEQLTKGTYECMVCCETVRAQNAVWGCSNCYHVFHLRCIKKWARSPNSVVAGADRDGWRCPACQNLSFKFPNQYRCFCGKVRDPEVSRMETPHSCGDVCQKDRGDGCKHPCNILCHPGPCPECNAIVTKSCDCGKTKQTVKCNQSMVIKCDSICERLLNCGRHMCKAKCHTGSCEKCEEVITQECYSSHESRVIVCGSEESFIESYSCNTICSKTLDCGNHTCESRCHRDDCVSCPTLPANVTHCPCGDTPLIQLDTKPRTSCLDPIPTCGGICKKILQCGPQENRHRCEKQCHEGPCDTCHGVTTVTCRCLFMDKEFKCSEIGQFTDETGSYICDKRCNRKKSCGRHKCGQPCCIREEHPCDLLCGRKLSCGLHKCDEPCHKTNCPPCLMAGFDELTCYCGAEVLYPPIPCGTSPPECSRPCTRDHGCPHPVRHNCHSEENCPPCTELTKKKCMGNHVLRANIPCHLTEISCGMKCSKPLPCGEHSCPKTCHKGECIEEGQVCSQPCQRKRELCEHICGAPCHGEEPCPQLPCKAKILIKCVCGNREAPSMCSAGGISMESTDYQKITMQSLKDSLHGIMGASSVNISKFNQGRAGQGRILECTEDCAVLERNRRVALALEIQNPDLSAKLGSPSYSDFLKDQAKQNSQFVAGIEKSLSDLVQSAKQSKQPSRSHPFPTMNSNQRRIVHELAEFYGCETQSYDFEPKKNVVATAVRDRCWLPALTLTSLVQRELHPRAPPPIPHFHKEESLRLTSQATKLSTSLFGDTTSTTTNTTATQPLAEGWQVIGKKTKKVTSSTSGSSVGSKSAIGTIDKFEDNLAEVCASGTVNYASLSKESKEALKAEPVIDYFDFTVT